jgi:hypothetical protein
MPGSIAARIAVRFFLARKNSVGKLSAFWGELGPPCKSFLCAGRATSAGKAVRCRTRKLLPSSKKMREIADSLKLGSANVVFPSEDLVHSPREADEIPGPDFPSPGRSISRRAPHSLSSHPKFDHYAYHFGVDAKNGRSRLGPERGVGSVQWAHWSRLPSALTSQAHPINRRAKTCSAVDIVKLILRRCLAEILIPSR